MENAEKDITLTEILEALLFITEEPLKLQELAEITGRESKDIESALANLTERYAIKNSLQIIQLAGGYQMATCPAAAPYIERLEKEASMRSLTQAALETLAVIAYKQPVTRVEIEAIRGVRVEKVLENLNRRKLIKMMGRKDAPGRPMTYGTTKYFLKFFGINSLKELPSLEKLKARQKSL